MHNVAVAKESSLTSQQEDARILEFGSEVMFTEAQSVSAVAKHLDRRFAAAVRLIQDTTGDVIVTGMGKAGHIGRKIAATFTSTGTRSHFLHPAEAIHGDLGTVRRVDVALVLSQSGETAEVLQVLPAFSHLGVPIIAITAKSSSSLGKAASIVLSIGRLQEACSLGLAPSTTTTVMLALGDALSLTVSRLRDFRHENFAQFHPGGSLGFKLSSVDDNMRPLEQCRVASEQQTVREVLVQSTRPGRRSGAIILTDETGRLTGLFTDSDLARLIEGRQEHALDQPIRGFMAKTPTTVTSGQRMTAAIEMLAERKFSELPVVDQNGRPVGIIDVTDVVGTGPIAPKSLATAAEASQSVLSQPTVRIFRGDQATDSATCSMPSELPKTE